MTDLLERLRTAERGTPWLSAEVLTAVTGAEHTVSVLGEIVRLGEQSERNVRSVAESIDAVWALAEAEGWRLDITTRWDDNELAAPALWYVATLRLVTYPKGMPEIATYLAEGLTTVLAICAALVAVKGGKQ